MAKLPLAPKHSELVPTDLRSRLMSGCASLLNLETETVPHIVNMVSYKHRSFDEREYEETFLFICKNLWKRWREGEKSSERSRLDRIPKAPEDFREMLSFIESLLHQEYVQTADSGSHKESPPQQQQQPHPESQFECRKCKSKDIVWTQRQTRSADEPMTTFCVCRQCGTRFKI